MQEAAQEAGAPRRPDPVHVARLGGRHRRAHAPSPHRPRARHRLARDGARGVLLGQADLRRRPGQRPRLHPRLGARHRLRGALHHGRQDLRLGHGLRLRAVGHRRPLGRARAAGGDGAPGRALPLRRRSRTQLTQLLFPQGGRGPSNVEAVSQSPATLAHLAGFAIPEGTQLLVVRPGRHRLRLPALARDPRARLQVHRGRRPRRGHRDRGRAAALRRRRPHGRRARARRGRHLALRRGRARLPRARQHAVAVRRHGLLDRRRPHVHDRHRHDRRLHLVRQHRRAAPHQPQARGRADPRLGDAHERPGRPARRRLGAQPRARRRRRATGAARRGSRLRRRPPAPARRRPPPRPPRRRPARVSRSSCARRSQR